MKRWIIILCCVSCIVAGTSVSALATVVPAHADSHMAFRTPASLREPGAGTRPSLPFDLLMLSFVVLLITGNVGMVALAVAKEFRRSLSFYTADAWLNPRYVRALPNSLSFFARKGFPIWPRRCTP